MLFLSGIGPRRPVDGQIPGAQFDGDKKLVSYDIASQVHQVFKNIEGVLSEAGASLPDLVDITVFLTNMAKDFQVFNEIYASYFPEGGPCRTTVEVGSLPTPIAIEFKCIAVLPTASS